jgi:hypothetical protein
MITWFCTIIASRTSGSGITVEDKRGKHGNHSRSNLDIINSVKEHINSIPEVESHYQRATQQGNLLMAGCVLPKCIETIQKDESIWVELQ